MTTLRLALVTFPWIFLCACTTSRERIYTGTAFGMAYEVRVFAGTKRLPLGEIEKWLDESFRQSESVVNAADKESEISRFNRSERLAWVPASRSLVLAVDEALRVAKLTQGAWDPTSGTLLDLYTKGGTKEPSPQLIATAKQKVGHYYVEARQDPLALKKSRRGVIVNLGLLANAFAVDEAAEMLKRKGIENFRIKSANVVRAAGSNAMGEFWPYSYQRPVMGSQTPLHLTNEMVPMENRAAASVSLPDGGTQVVRSVDPRSGKPLVTDLLNVTVMDLSALRAQAMAEGLFAVGKVEAIPLARKQGAAAYFVAQSEESGIAEATPLFPSPLKNTY